MAINSNLSDSNLGEIATRCRDLLSSPYLFRELPPELRNLRSLLRTVDKLARDDVPSLVAEVKRLRIENKRLTLQANAARLASKASKAEKPRRARRVTPMRNGRRPAPQAG